MRFIVNIALKTAMIVFLNYIGWLTLMSHGHVAKGGKEIVSVAFGAALIFTVATVLTLLFTLGLAAILWVFLGWFILHIMHGVAPGFIELSQNGWLTVLSGFLIMAATLPREKESSRTTSRIMR